jgi:VanZ family protein
MSPCGWPSAIYPERPCAPVFPPFTSYPPLATAASPLRLLSPVSSGLRPPVAKTLRIGSLVLTFALLAAIATCSLAPSPNMREMAWIPGWIGEWADKNPNFRNMPVFAALSALIVLVVTSYPRLATRYGRWHLAFGAGVATALLGVSLEVLQLLFLPNRHFDWADIVWMTTGAFGGASVAFSFGRMLSNIRYKKSAE